MENEIEELLPDYRVRVYINGKYHHSINCQKRINAAVNVAIEQAALPNRIAKLVRVDSTIIEVFTK